jgi:hypothetical protein
MRSSLKYITQSSTGSRHCLSVAGRMRACARVIRCGKLAHRAHKAPCRRPAQSSQRAWLTGRWRAWRRVLTPRQRRRQGASAPRPWSDLLPAPAAHPRRACHRGVAGVSLVWGWRGASVGQARCHSRSALRGSWVVRVCERRATHPRPCELVRCWCAAGVPLQSIKIKVS